MKLDLVCCNRPNIEIIAARTHHGHMTLGVVCCRRSKVEEIAANQTSQLEGLAFLMSGSLQSASFLQAPTQASQLPIHRESATTANVSF